ncbi:MAG TPA: hypothetical protein VJ508_12950 [Saprospiraceae bacterium]|nr:hypothetical protein [Saprospiraceae bacterium]
MMPRRSTLYWIGLLGIIFFVGGYVLNKSPGNSRILHLSLGTPVHRLMNGSPEQSLDTLPFSIRLDSLNIGKEPGSPVYELQVRQADKTFDEEIHQAIQPPSRLVSAFPLVPMKIRHAGDSPYRFRLKAFYPDFTFKYTYPENRDTIPPKAPGITLQLKTKDGDQVITLRSGQPGLNKLDDIVHFGMPLEYFYGISEDSLQTLSGSTDTIQNKIIFAGKTGKMYFFLNHQLETRSLDIGQFISIPGKDSLGFTVIQNFPDVHFLKAIPATKSDGLLNPVASVEVWKLGSYSSEIFLYPFSYNRQGGQWSVPGTNLILTLGLEHYAMARRCTYSIMVADSVRHTNETKKIQGNRGFSFRNRTFRLHECDPNGLWANLVVGSSTGLYFRLLGIGMVIAVLAAMVWQKTNHNNRDMSIKTGEK